MTDTLLPPQLDTPGSTSTNAQGRRPALPPRPARRPTSLPSGRALLGGLLITIAVVGTYVAVAGDDGAPRTRWLVARHDIDAGTRLTPGDLSVAAIELPDAVARNALPAGEATGHALPADAEGAITLAPLRAGALLQRSQLLAAPVGTETAGPVHELSLRLPPERAVGGTLNRGERVDVLATYGNGVDATTIVVARDAIVTRLDREEAASLGDDGGLTLSLLLPDDDTVLAATHAKDVAALTLVRATRDGEPGAPAPGGATDRYTGPTPPDSTP
jgi:Flp pilus assembly protein CpaB